MWGCWPWWKYPLPWVPFYFFIFFSNLYRLQLAALFLLRVEFKTSLTCSSKGFCTFAATEQLTFRSLCFAAKWFHHTKQPKLCWWCDHSALLTAQIDPAGEEQLLCWSVWHLKCRGCSPPGLITARAGGVFHSQSGYPWDVTPQKSCLLLES